MEKGKQVMIQIPVLIVDEYEQFRKRIPIKVWAKDALWRAWEEEVGVGRDVLPAEAVRNDENIALLDKE